MVHSVTIWDSGVSRCSTCVIPALSIYVVVSHDKILIALIRLQIENISAVGVGLEQVRNTRTGWISIN